MICPLCKKDVGSVKGGQSAHRTIEIDGHTYMVGVSFVAERYEYADVITNEDVMFCRKCMVELLKACIVELT